MEGILNYCIRAKVRGIICFGMGMTLRAGDREYYYRALDRYFPEMKERYQKRYGYAYEVPSERNRELMKLFYAKCAGHGIMSRVDDVFAYLKEFPKQEKYEQMSLF